MHDLHSKTCSVENICPGVKDVSLVILDRLVEVESVEVKRHGADAEGGKPDSHDWPRCEEEMQRARIVERSILEDQTTEVSMCCNNVVGLFFLTELVTIVLRLCFSGFTYKTGSNETSVHSREKRSTEYPSNTEHMERVHKDVVFCLEYKHIVKSTRNTKRHTIAETTLTERINKEYCGSCCYRSRVSNTDPRTHTETVRQFPLTTHIGKDADEKVEDYQLVGTTIVEPLIERSCFPDGIEVESNSVRRRNNSTRDDVITIHERTSNWFTDSVDVHRRSSDECGDETDGCRQQSWDHQYTEPTDIQTIVCGRYPGAKIVPVRFALLASKN